MSRERLILWMLRVLTLAISLPLIYLNELHRH